MQTIHLQQLARHLLLRKLAVRGNEDLDIPDGVRVREWGNKEIVLMYLSDDRAEIVAAETYVAFGDGIRKYHEAWFSEEALNELERHLNVS